MGPSRREFLGTSIGTIVLTGASFKAIEANPFEHYSDELSQVERTVKLLRSPRSVQQQCRVLILMEDGTYLKGPEIQRIEQTKLNSIKFHCFDLQVSRKVILEGAVLINNKNELVQSNKFVFPQLLLSAKDHEKYWDSVPENSTKERPKKWSSDTLKLWIGTSIGLKSNIDD